MTLTENIADRSSLHEESIQKREIRTLNLVYFEASGVKYALPSEIVERVIPCKMVIPVPHSSEFLLGIVNEKMSVLTVLDVAYIISGMETPREKVRFLIRLLAPDPPLSLASENEPQGMAREVEDTLPAPETEDMRVMDILAEEGEGRVYIHPRHILEYPGLNDVRELDRTLPGAR